MFLPVLKIRCFIRILLAFVLVLLAAGCAREEGLEEKSSVKANNDKTSQRPNIIVILADDMGYGDIAAYNPASKVPTPNLNKLAAEGMRFTDAHSPSSVCTPTRYSLLTGRYAWRTRLKKGVLNGSSRLLIDPQRETLASLLKDAGYHTATIGKWHIGLGDPKPDYKNPDGLRPGVNEVGFDYFFGISASLDMPPYVYIENGSTSSPLTGNTIDAEQQRRRGGKGFWRAGEIGDDFVHQEVLPVLTEKAVEYVHSRSSDTNDSPFFLYFPLPAPHTPWLPTQPFQGVSGAGHYGDFAAQVDDTVGQLMRALEQAGIDDNTLVIFTSDNGAHWLPSDIKQYGHLANGDLRGQKADIHEGGHRVPFIARWHSRIPAETVSHQPLTLADLMATFARITGQPLEQEAGADSFDLANVFLGTAEQVERGPMIHHALNGLFAIREGDWKLVEGLGSGGFTQPRTVEPGEGEAPYQLYNLAQDPSEQNNLAAEHPDVVERLVKALDRIRDGGRSRP
ncbi:sulfatase family protein [Porticoccus sp. GXU_MW_L64]